MRDVAAGDAAGLLLVEALREPDPLPGVGTARMQRAHGARELAHLEEELHGERAEGGAREPSLREAAPERMAAEGAARVDHRPQTLDERGAVRHRPRLLRRAGRLQAADPVRLAARPIAHGTGTPPRASIR